MKLDAFAKDLLLCNHCRCGFCREECPVYKEERFEGVSPKGRMEIIQGLYEGFLEPSTKLYNRLSTCNGCMYCTLRCPTQKNNLKERFDAKIDPCGATDAALADLAAMGHIPESVISIKESLEKEHNVFGYPNTGRDKWVDSGIDVPQSRYHKDKADVLYFVGCVSSLPTELNEVAFAFAKILEKSGTDFTILGEDEWCCGYRPLLLGLTEESEKMKAHNIEQVKKLGATKVVFSCPSCYSMWVNEYNLEGVELLHSTQFIQRLIDEGKLELEEFDGSVTYHDPCDLGRREEIYDIPRNILKSIPGVKFTELNKNHEEGLCCGGGRLLDIIHPDVSSAVSDRLGQAIQAADVDVVVDACPQCKRMIMPKAKNKAVKDLVEIVYEIGKFK